MVTAIRGGTHEACANCGIPSYGNKFCGKACTQEYHLLNRRMTQSQLNVLRLLAERRAWVSFDYNQSIYSLVKTRRVPLIVVRNETSITCEAHILPAGEWWLAHFNAMPQLATVNGNDYRFYTNTHKGKDYITVEHLDTAGQTSRRDYVRQPHPAFQDGQWQPGYFEKLVRAGNYMRQRAMRKVRQ